MRGIRPAGLIAAALCLLGSGCFGDDLPVVETAPVGAAQVAQTVSAPGRVDAAARQDVAASVSGVVVAVEVADGDEVEAGQVVVRLDSSQVELAREQAAAAQQAATAAGGINVAGTGGTTLASVQAAVADLDASVPPRIEEAREKASAIADEGQRAAALAAVDAVEVSYLTTRAGLLSTGEALAAGQDATARSLSRALTDAVMQATAAQRAQASAAAAAAEAQTEELVVAAPFAGTVQFGEAAATDGAAPPGVPGDVAALAGAFGGLAGAQGGGTLRVGAPVVAGQTLFTVFDRSATYVNADVDEVDAPQIETGQRATVFVDAFPEREFAGVVESVRVEAAPTEAGGVGYPARVRVLEAAAGDAGEAAALAGLRIGMTASVEVTTVTVDADLAVPSRALLRRDGGSAVFTVVDGRARLVGVRVLALGEDLAAVEADLPPRAQVIVAGYEDLADGDEVELR